MTMMERRGPVTIQTNSGECVLRSDVSLNLNWGGYRWTMYYAGGVWTNGPPHDPTYTDDVWAFGVNMAGVGAKEDPAKQYAAWHMESKFYQGPTQQSPLTEVFLHVVDINDDVRRPIAWVGCHDGSWGNVNLAASQITFQDNDHVPKLNFDFRAANACRIEDGFSFTYADNNVPIARQFNADGTSAHALPYIDDQSNTVIVRPITTQASQGNASGPVFTSRGLNTSGARVQAPDANACTVEMSCGRNGTRRAGLFGVDAANNLIFGQTGGGGSLYFDFNFSVIFRARQAGHAKVAEMTSAGLALGVPVKLRTYTPSTLPSAVTCGEGSMIFVKDAPGGSAPAVSDGVSWRPLMLGPPL
jgi:hypothetical protein